MRLSRYLLFFAFLTLLQADGLRDYKKTCQKCHGDAYYGAQMKTSQEWKEYFQNGSDRLLKDHIGITEAIRRFESSYFKKHFKQLKEFLIRHASDTGPVRIRRGCDI